MSPCVTFRLMNGPATQRRAPKAPTEQNGCITFITIPAPPSVNALFRNVPGQGRVKTGAYKDWIQHAGWRLKSQNPATVAGRVIIIIGIERESAASDIDNRVKALFDLLVTHRVIGDDKLVTAFAIAWAAKGAGLARVAIMPASDLMLNFHLASDGKSGGWFINSPDQEGPANDGY